MKNDEELPFDRRIAQYIIADSGYAQSFRSFRVATRAARKVINDALSEAKWKAQDESHEAIAAEVAASELVSDQGFMIKQGSTPKYPKTNTTCNTDKPQSFQTPNALENSSQNLKEPNHFGRSNLTTQLGKDNIEDSDEINLHCLYILMGNVVNISLISSLLGFFLM